MFVHQLFEANTPPRRLVVTYPGRFQPFHKGHRDVFASLQSRFGRDHVFIVTSNATDGIKSPFNFSDKVRFMHAMGVPDDRIIESNRPYQLPAIFESQKDHVVFITVVGAPDANRLGAGATKKDGTPAYFQPFPGKLEDMQSAAHHGYVIVEPERPESVVIGGQKYNASHGTDTRNLWNQVRRNPQQRAEFIQQLYGRNDPELGTVLDKIQESTDMKIREAVAPQTQPQQAQTPAVNIPPPENAQRTQIPGTLPTYQKAVPHLDKHVPAGKTLDFGAGLGLGAQAIGADSYEPYPGKNFTPTYSKADSIPDESYARITNFNVLNVVPREIRDHIVQNIGRILMPGGIAIITTRGKDVMSAAGQDGPEPLSRLTTRGTYQKGFTKAELLNYVKEILGQGFEVSSVNLGPAGVLVRKIATTKSVHEAVGLVRAGNDPRYVMATMGDQNDVDSKTLGKMMKGYHLVGTKAPKTGQQAVKGNIAEARIDHMNDYHEKLEKLDNLQRRPGLTFKERTKIRQGQEALDNAYHQHTMESTDMSEPQKHIVAVTISDPNSPAVSKRKETYQRRCTVTASGREAAIDTAIRWYRKQGYKVHDHHYIGLKDQPLGELSPNTLKSYSKKAQQDLGNKVSQIKAGGPDKQALLSKAEKRVSNVKLAHNKYKSAMNIEEDQGFEPGDEIEVTTIKGRTYKGVLSHEGPESIVFTMMNAGNNIHNPADQEPRKEVVAIKKSHIKAITKAGITEAGYNDEEGEDPDLWDQQDPEDDEANRLKWTAGGATAGTHLMDKMTTSYTELESIFGPPEFGPNGQGGDKVTCEWVITFGDGNVVTIYDWNYGETPFHQAEWNVGAKNRQAVWNLWDIIDAHRKGSAATAGAAKNVTEAKSLAKRVRVVKGPNAGKTGWIREIKHGMFKGAPKTYYVDLDDGTQENNVPGTALRLVKDVEEAVGDSRYIGTGAPWRGVGGARHREDDEGWENEKDPEDRNDYWSKNRQRAAQPQQKPQLTMMYFYNVGPADERDALAIGLTKTKTGKWVLKKYNTSGFGFNKKKASADIAFGSGRAWMPKVQEVQEDAEQLNIGDPVIITGNVQFEGSTGEIDSFGKDKRFVIVNLYNHGRHSFHSSDVSYNDYADSDDEDARMYDNDPDARNHMHAQSLEEGLDTVKQELERLRKLGSIGFHKL